MNKRLLCFLSSIIIITISYLISYLFIHSFSLIYFYFQLISLISILLIYSHTTIKEKSIIQPIIIVNILIVFMFVLRPIVLINSDYSSILATSNSLRTYSFLHGINSIHTFPIHKLNNIILIGSFFINLGYFRLRKIINVESKKFEYKNILINKDGLLLLGGIIVFSLVLFFSRYNYSTLLHAAGKLSIVGIDFSTLDILWAYLFPFLIAYIYFNSCKYNKRPVLAIILSIIYIVLIMCISRRYFAVNLFIILFMIYYYNKKNNKIDFKLLLMVLGMFAVVLLYANVRGASINKVQESSVFLKILSEFDMYDMLLCSQHYIEHFGSFGYNGFCYLSLPIIPRWLWSSKPLHFDGQHTYFLLKGLIHGGIPTSIIGSLYLNFNTLGITVLCFLFGTFLNMMYKSIYPLKSIYHIIMYALIISFTYDIFRVGDISRELWTFTVYVICYLITAFLAFKKNEGGSDQS